MEVRGVVVHCHDPSADKGVGRKQKQVQVGRQVLLLPAPAYCHEPSADEGVPWGGHKSRHMVGR